MFPSRTPAWQNSFVNYQDAMRDWGAAERARQARNAARESPSGKITSRLEGGGPAPSGVGGWGGRGGRGF
jgi:hypothetical protein